MSRPEPVNDADLSPAMAALVEKFGENPNYANGLKIFAHKQEVFAPIWNAYSELLEHGKLDRELKELVRLKIAQNNTCSPYVESSSRREHALVSPVSVDIDPDKAAAIGSFEVSDRFSAREKLALKFAEKLGIEPEALDDEFFNQLRGQFTDPEIVELAHVAAVGIGFERFVAVWEPRVCAVP